VPGGTFLRFLLTPSGLGAASWSRTSDAVQDLSRRLDGGTPVLSATPGTDVSSRRSGLGGHEDRGCIGQHAASSDREDREEPPRQAETFVRIRRWRHAERWFFFV
jgi:hypothetical protein